MHATDGDSWGVKSLLLDDDGCYCASLIEAGKIFCWPKNGKKNSWGASPRGKSISAGVDFVAPQAGCSYVNPKSAPLSFYFREATPERNVGGSCAGDLSKVASLTVVGTGMPAWEGTYMISKARIDGVLAFQKDETHEVYRGGSGAWRLADYGGAVLYPD